MPTLETIGKFFTVVPDPMVLVDSRGTIVLASANTYSLFGYGPDELTGKSVNCLLPERYRATHGRRLEEYFLAPSLRSMGIGMELSACRADGSEFPVEISLSPYRPAQALFALAAIRDITERKRLEEARSESHRQKQVAEERAQAAQVLANRNEALRAIFDASPIGIYTCSKDCRVDRWNRSAERIFGYAANEVVGTIIWDLDRMLEAEKDSSAPLLAELSQGEGFRNLQLRRRKKDGRIIDVSLNAAPLRDLNGGDAGFVRMVEDISERTMIEQQFRQSQKMEAVGQLTGGIA
ncbi:MAG: PAS domain S-box protein, partial [Terracidiphilus sp.]